MTGMPTAKYQELVGWDLMTKMSEYSPWEQPSGRILFVDAYDSFSNNIIALLKEELLVEVDVVRMDLPSVPGRTLKDRWTAWSTTGILACYEAIVCGPGPGCPTNPHDVGIFKFLYELENPVPILGICLGFQSLVVYAGGKIRRLKRGMHGMVRNIEFNPKNALDTKHVLYKTEPFKATLYHSLCADIGQDVVPQKHWDVDKWGLPPQCPDLIPLGWTVEPRDDGTEERILMIVEHVDKPFLGLQYHPESVCTDPAGHKILKNWITMVREWNKIEGRVIIQDITKFRAAMPCMHQLSLSHLEEFFVLRGDDGSSGTLSDHPPSDDYESWKDFQLEYQYTCEKIPLPKGFGVPEVVDALHLDLSQAIILDSSSSRTGDPLAAHSIIAVGLDDTLQIHYRTDDDILEVLTPPSFPGPRRHTVPLGGCTPWEDISVFWAGRQASLQSSQQQKEMEAGPDSFKGGFMGYVTYELGLEGIKANVPLHKGEHQRPDLCFAWVTKSVVLDHRAGVIYVQNLASESRGDMAWAKANAKVIQRSRCWRKGKCIVPKFRDAKGHPDAKICPPQPEDYMEKVRECQDKIAEGQAYELCLTAQTYMSRPHDPTEEGPWELYLTLRERLSAPFGSFIRLGGATLLSSSPERFLNYDRDGVCTMRPMKGTVRKSKAVSTLKQAEKILHVPKEEAENLMIVDLVRHDMHGVCGPAKVVVRDLLKVEEYSNVFQMITVVKGQLPFMKHFTGLDVLSAALPPGSMTGAPKKRSCELLHAIERSEERSLYSGVVGYMDITGKGDWSVTIRSMFRWDDEVWANPEGGGLRDLWRAGAGGAVTILSTPEGETEEMFVKLSGPSSVFQDAG